MKKRKPWRNVNVTLFTLALLLVSITAAFPQQEQNYPRGAILDEAAYNSLPRKAPLTIQSLEGLPPAASLKQFAPLPGDQTDYGTCVAWASAYAARTISESVALNRRNQSLATASAFSPVYVYRTIMPDDPECQQGAQIHWALDLMKSKGAVKILEIERERDFPRVALANYDESRRYTISDYVTLFGRGDKSKTNLTVRMVKKSIAEGRPVIIGMNTPDSFIEAKGVWRPRESPDDYYGGHAMCVVGYDDERSGGVFEVMNSWGKKWGNGGFIWIPYKVFSDFVMEGYEMIENLAAYSDTVKYAGSLWLETQGFAGFQTEPLGFTDGVYKVSRLLPKGTEFRFAAGSSESAYLYAFVASLPHNSGEFYTPIQIFPQTGISPLLNYRDSVVTLPGGDKTLAPDAAPGVEYLVVLYAKQGLDLRDIMRRFENAEGTVPARLRTAVGPYLLRAEDISYSLRGNEAVFTVETRSSKAVAGLVVEIDHY